MGLVLHYNRGQTSLSEDEKEGLLLRHITTQEQLNEAEHSNIEEAVQWTMQKKFIQADILSEVFVRQLHKRMYSDVWRWAGEFRKTDKNIGVDWKQISIALRSLIDDCIYWIKHQTYSHDEIAVRFKHRIVSIHCFSNGNGRHSRLIADVIVKYVFGEPVFTWGRKSFTDPKARREAYIEALQAADRENLRPLIEFARS